MGLPGEAVEGWVYNLKSKIVIDAQMLSLLKDTPLLKVEPELQFEPDSMASYATSATVLNTIKASGITGFGFVRNERHREFGKST